MRRIFRLTRSLRTLPAALALVLAAGAVAPAAAAAPAAPAGERTVSSGWNDYSCKPSSAHPRPVVLIHGTYENAAQNWAFMAPYLTRRGYCVFSFDYGKLPGVPFVHGLGPIAKSAEELSAFVDKVRAATGTGKVDLVGHSQGGGAMPRYYLNFLDGAGKVDKLVGLAPSNHGTTLSGLQRLLDAIPGGRRILGTVSAGSEDQLVGSEFIKRLNSVPDTVPGVRYTTIVTRYDEVVTPYRTQFLSGPNVRNVLIQDLCKVDLSEHLTIGTVDRIAFHEVANALDPANATPTTCASAVTG
ncbi:esterase/lipase family protein [Streptomyces luteireticuli]